MSCTPDPPGDGFLGLRLRVTENPTGKVGELNSVNLKVSEIRVVHHLNNVEQILTLEKVPREILIDVKKDNIVNLGILAIPPGVVSQIRFVLSDGSVVSANSPEKLKTPSAEQSGLKLNPVDEIGFVVEAGKVTTLEAQFKPNKGMVNNKGVGYLLKPTIPTVVLQGAATTETLAGVVHDEVVVTFKLSVAKSRIDAILAAKNMVIRTGIQDRNYFTIGLPDAISVFDANEYFKILPEVEVVLPNVLIRDRVKPNETIYPSFELPIWWAQMDMPAAWDLTIGSATVKVGVLEAGFDLEHPDLVRNIFINEAELPTEMTSIVAGKKALDCNGDNIISFYDLNCEECTQTTTACIANLSAVTSAICSRAAELCIAPMTNITPTVLLAATDDGTDADKNGFVDDIVGWDFVQNDNNPSTGAAPEFRHGTEIIGMIGAQTNNTIGVAGVAWRVRLVPLRRDKADQVVLGADYASRKIGVEVLNLSGGFTYFAGADDPVCQAFKANLGQAFVNEKRQKLQKQWDQALDLSSTLFSVSPPNCTANIDMGNEVLDWPSQWSNPSVIVSAPFNATGLPTSSIIAKRLPGKPGFVLVPGGSTAGAMGDSTSYTAGFVSGAAALMSACQPSIKGPALHQKLVSTGESLDVVRLLTANGLPCQ